MNKQTEQELNFYHDCINMLRAIYDANVIDEVCYLLAVKDQVRLCLDEINLFKQEQQRLDS